MNDFTMGRLATNKQTNMKRAILLLTGLMLASLAELHAAGPAEWRVALNTDGASVAKQPCPELNGGALAAGDLVKRLLPKQAHSFVFETITDENGADVFEIESRNDRIVLRGNNGVAMAMGLNWYLKHFCHCHVSWCGNQLRLPEPLPRVEPKVRQVSWAKHRYFLNYCCFGYSLPWWDWPKWEQLIDWMALNGVNMPLAVTGQEAVWDSVCRQLGMSDAQVTEFLAGPPYLPFQWMGCLDGYGGPLPKKWISKRQELEKKILARERAFGMKPVLQGFTGHVPGAVAKLFPGAPLQKIKWIEWETYLLDPLDPLFAKIAKMYMEEQTRLYGSDHLYASDTFIEMTPPNGDLKYLADLARAIYHGMANTDQQAIWVIQGWPFMIQQQFWTQPRLKGFLDAIPNDRMVVLDLACEWNPVWSKTEAFCGKPWLWCNVQNFGRRVYLAAWLGRNNDGLFGARQDPKSGKLIGLGFVNEGLCYNPVAYDFMFEAAWRTNAVDLPAWIDEYAHHRYGSQNVAAARAWRILLDAVYMNGAGPASVIDRFPKLQVASTPHVCNSKLSKAWRALDEASSELGQTDTFRFDLVNVARQALVNHAGVLQSDIAKARKANDVARFEQASKHFLQLIADVDELLATRKEFLLGDYLEDARRWGDTKDERAKCEWNARRVLTLWGQALELNDYAGKEWSGMFNGYYALRWKNYLDAVAESMRNNKPFDDAKYEKDSVTWTAAWADNHETYSAKPRGDSVAVAHRLLVKYTIRNPVAATLTTDKPVTCSSSLPDMEAEFANDGGVDTGSYWGTDVSRDKAAWWQVDLERETIVGRVIVICYYGDQRSYGFTVEGSIDGQKWDLLADRRENKELSTQAGYTCSFEPRKIRYLRVTQTANSANAGRHLVEVQAFEK